MDLSNHSHDNNQNLGYITYHLSELTDNNVSPSYFLELVSGQNLTKKRYPETQLNFEFISQLAKNLRSSPPLNLEKLVPTKNGENSKFKNNFEQGKRISVAIEHLAHFKLSSSNGSTCTSDLKPENDLNNYNNNYRQVITVLTRQLSTISNQPPKHELEIIIVRGLAPLSFLDHDTHTYYLDENVLSDTLYLEYVTFRDLFLWHNSPNDLRSAIIASLTNLCQNVTERDLSLFYTKLAKTYSIHFDIDQTVSIECVADKILDSINKLNISDEVNGKFHYCTEYTNSTILSLTQNLCYELSSTKNPDIPHLNSVQKWTQQSIHFIQEMIQARILGYHVLMIGDAGTGKDWVAMKYGKVMGEDPIVISLSEDLEGPDLIASRGLHEGVTIWEYGQIVKAYIQGDIIVLDEVNKTRPGVCATLNNIMESDQLEMPDGTWVQKGQGFQIIATMNEPGEAYGGYDIDPGFKDRFGTVLYVPELSFDDRIRFLKRIADNKTPTQFIEELVRLQDRINSSGKVWRKMSLRVLERIIESKSNYPREPVANLIRSEYLIGTWEQGHDVVEKEILAFSSNIEDRFEKELLNSLKTDRTVNDSLGTTEYNIGIAENRIWLCYNDSPYLLIDELVGPSRPIDHIEITTDKRTVLAISDTQLWFWHNTAPNKWVCECIDITPDTIEHYKHEFEISLTPLRSSLSSANSTPTVKDGFLCSGTVKLPLGNDKISCPGIEYDYYIKETPTNNNILHKLFLGLSLNRNVLLIGNVGTGKSWLSKSAFRLLQRSVEHMSLHEGTTVQDLLVWQKTVRVKDELSLDLEVSPLVRAAIEGKPCIIDEINRASTGVLAVLNHILQFREIILPKKIRYNNILTDRITISPGFKLVMTMNPPQQHTGINQMLADFMDRMYCVWIDYLPPEEERSLLKNIWYNIGGDTTTANFDTELRKLISIATITRDQDMGEPQRAISTRSLEKLVHFKKEYPKEHWLDILSMLTGVEGAVSPEKMSFFISTWDSSNTFSNQIESPHIRLDIASGTLEAGGKIWSRKDNNVRSRYFSGIEQNDRIIDLLAKARNLGSHVLLVGEAGTGKDWLSLAYGELMGENSMVISLSEEVEGQELIAKRDLNEGVTVWEYSHIVKAYQEGSIIIIDEVTRTRPGVRAILNEIMDSDQLEMPDGTWVQKGQGFQIIATMNEVKEGYEGYELGEDFEDRFGAVLEVKELPDEEKLKFLKRVDPNNTLISDTSLISLIDLQNRINGSKDVWRKVSLRVLERIVEMKVTYPDIGIDEIIRSEFMIGHWETGKNTVDKLISILPPQLLGKRDWRFGSELNNPCPDIIQMRVSSNGSTAVLMDRSGKLLVSELNNGKIVGHWHELYREPDHKDRITLSSDGNLLIVNGMYAPPEVWERGNNTWLKLESHILDQLSKVISVFVATDNSFFLIVTLKGSVWIWYKNEDMTFARSNGIRLKEDGNRVLVTSLSPDNKSLLLLDDKDTLHILDISKSDLTKKSISIPIPTSVITAIWSPTSKLIACVGYAGNIYLIKPTLSNNTETHILFQEQVESTDLGLLSWSEDGRYLVAAGINDGTLYLWHSISEENIGSEPIKLKGPVGKLTDMKWSCDHEHNWLFSYGNDYKIHAWKIYHNRPPQIEYHELKFNGNPQKLKSVHISPNTQFIIGYGMNNSLYTWSKTREGGWASTSTRLITPEDTTNFDTIEFQNNYIYASSSKDQKLFFWRIPESFAEPLSSIIESVERDTLVPHYRGNALISGTVRLDVNKRNSTLSTNNELLHYFTTDFHSNNQALHKLMLGLSLKRNILLLGPVGSGKTFIATSIFKLLNTDIEQMSLHESTTELDLTAWQKTERIGHDISLDLEISPLVRAAIEGKPCLIEGVNRASSGVLAVLNHALQFREIILPKKVRIGSMNTDRISVHKNFRLVMTAIPPGGLVDVNPLLADFMDRMFTINLDYLAPDEEKALLHNVWYNETSSTPTEHIRDRIHELVEMADRRRILAIQNFRRTVTTRTLVRTIKFKALYPDEHWIDILGMMCGVEGAIDDEQIKVWKISWEAKFGDKSVPIVSEKPQLSTNYEKVDFGDIVWQRKYPSIKCRYISGIGQNDNVVTILSKMRSMSEHVLLVGEAGTGKDWLSLAYGELMGEDPIVISLSEETEAQDLIAMRGLKAGITVWEYSHIVEAYREGKIIILDEVTRVRPGVRAILNEIMESDQLEMPDGTWLNKTQGFQIIATMNEVKEGYEGYELGEDFEDRFGAVLEIKELPVQEKLNFLQKTCNNELPYSFLTRLIELQTSINSEKTIWRKMSLRVLERIVENIVTHPEEPLSTIIHSEFMVGYWEEGHELVNSKVSYLVSEVGEHVLLSKNSTHTQSDTITPYYDKGHLISGHLSFPLLPQSNIKSNKPTINYFNKRTKTNDRSLHQTLLGIHLNRNVLLVGPQGCGKTWLAHSVFDLLDKNVEHMSLHESTTVHDLTVWQKTVRKKDDMFIELELSPLVRSAVEGRPCIIDDVNRAPPGVLAVLNHALQFREIILPQGIDTSNPNISSNSYKVTAKKGFQLIFTATIPEDTNQINPMMADFMDRMYCINMTYLPPSEEVEVMKRLIGIKELDHDCMHQLGTLVRLINQLREKCNDGKPTFRSTERIAMNLKHFPDMDIRTLLNRELRLSSREDELDLNTNDLNDLYMLTDVLETQYPKPCIKCTPLNEVVYRGYNLSLPVPENEIETYDPNRWWEAGKPTLYQSERARKRQRILQRLLETVTALDIPLHPWKKPRSNALDSSSKPSWGCTFAQDIPRIKNVFFSPWDLLYRDNDESIYGLLFHEIFEILYRNTTQFSTEFLSLPGSRILVNAIGDIWINQQGMAQFPGTCDWILALYEESFDSEKLVVEHDEYPHIQFITLLLYYWRFGAINRGISTDHFGTDVINAFNSLQDKIDQIISTQNETELIELTKQLYYTPQFQQLIKRSLYLTIEDIHIDPPTKSEKDAIISMASTKLTDYERNTKLSTQPVNETGRQVTSEEFEELRNFILDAIKESRIELERLDEDNEAKKRVDELKKAELEREERLLEGITEREQKEFQVRYERVMDHIKLMRDKFRQIYRHERGIWRRHLAQGRLDSTQLASLVAGNDRVFMKREQPERYMVRISLLIDQSASMQGDKIDHVSDAVLMLLSAIQSDQRKGVNVEVVGFHDDKPMEIYLKYGEHLTKKKIIKVVNDVSRTKGRNNDLQAIYYAFERIPKHDRRSLNLIIHFSDGDPNQQFDRDQFKDLVNKYSNIIVVGFGIGAQGTNFVLDLYPEDQATIAEETSEIPERLSSLIRRYVSST